MAFSNSKTEFNLLKLLIHNWLEKNVSKKRFEHIIGVVRTARKYAKKLKLNLNNAELSALLHDCAKELTNKQLLRLARKFRIKLDKVDYINPHVLHARVGECIAKKKFGIKDKDVLEGIRCHTLAEPDMSRMAMMIYLADSTEPGRDKKRIIPIKKAFKEEGLEKAVLIAIDQKLIDVIKKEKIIHPYTICARNWLIKKINK